MKCMFNDCQNEVEYRISVFTGENLVLEEVESVDKKEQYACKEHWNLLQSIGEVSL